MLEKLGGFHLQLPFEGRDSLFQFGMNGDKPKQKRRPFIHFADDSVVKFFMLTGIQRSSKKSPMIVSENLRNMNEIALMTVVDQI